MVHGYSGIDNCSKVQHLLEGIKTPKLNPVKTQIMANPALRQDYPACVTLFKDFIKQDNLTPNVRDAAILAVGSTRHDSDDWNDVEPDMTVEDQYYKPAEYASLSAAKKAGLIAKRKRRGGKNAKAHKAKKTKSKPQRNNKAIKLTKGTIKALATAMRDDGDNSDSGSNDNSNEEVPMKPPAKKLKSNNRNNAALKRH